MEWTDRAIVLSCRPHGESSALVSLLTPNYGRHAGMVRGGQSARQAGALQIGNRVDATWRARLSEHLGMLVVDMSAAYAAAWLDDPFGLAVLQSACAVTEAALPERLPMASVYESLEYLLSQTNHEDLGAAYARWELELLAALGYGLDLSCCAATGDTQSLTYVSPRSGRAVSTAAGEPYRNRLLALPDFLVNPHGFALPQDICDALRLTGFFLERHVFNSRKSGLPFSRARLLQMCEGHPQTGYDLSVLSAVG